MEIETHVRVFQKVTIMMQIMVLIANKQIRDTWFRVFFCVSVYFTFGEIIVFEDRREIEVLRGVKNSFDVTQI
jgi:hypothetical protein